MAKKMILLKKRKAEITAGRKPGRLSTQQVFVEQMIYSFFFAIVVSLSPSPFFSWKKMRESREVIFNCMTLPFISMI